MAKTFSQQLADARLMANGIKQNLDALKAIGLGDDEVTALESALEEATALDNRQETLKAELKTCTAQLGEVSRTLSEQVMAAKKRVKLVIPYPSILALLS